MDLSRFTPFQKRLLILLAAALAVLAVYELLPSTRLRAKHQALLEWAEKGGAGDFPEEFAAPDYNDQWEQTPALVVERMRAVRFGFPALRITAGEPEFSRNGGSATVKQTLEATGTDTRRKAEFTFRWRRQSWLPWSWRLEFVEAPGLDL